MESQKETMEPKNVTNGSKKRSTLWNNDMHITFVGLCMEEVQKGNKIGGHFNKTGKGNLVKNMNEKTGRKLEWKQLKNHWDGMKNDWKLYDRLMKKETGIGWDSANKTIEASDEWWDEKIEGDERLAKFRGANLEQYKLYYEPLFQYCVATGDRTISPSDYKNDVAEGSGDSDDPKVVPVNEGVVIPEGSTSKRKQRSSVAHSRSTKSKSSMLSSFDEQLAQVMEVLTSRSTQTFPPQNQSPTLEECMDITLCFPGYEEGSKKYCQALTIFMHKAARVGFMFPKTHMGKMAFLEGLIEKENK